VLESTETLTAADGAQLHVWRWEPDGDVAGVVQIAHGLAEHAERYRWLAEQLTAAGWAVLADDHRGHGRTAAGPADLGFLAEEDGWTRVVDDLHRLTARARELHPDVPVVLLGHSMGSFLTQQYLFTFPAAVDAAVLSGSDGPAGAIAVAGGLVARVERRRIGPRGRSDLLNTLGFGAYNKAFAPARTDFDFLSRDEEQVDAYVADPLCGFVATTQLWIDLLGGLRVIGDPSRVAGVRRDLPVLLLSGSEDPVGGTTGVAKLHDLYTRAGLTDVEVQLHEGARHEMFNETNRAEVAADLLAWLGRATRVA
jgi:alpha-beta hydrolase superfamily lysophospholipase